MVIKRDIESLFQPDEDGRIQISQEAPTVLKTAINEAEKRLDNGSDWVVQSVGEPRRAIDFGIEGFLPIQTNSATIFTGEVEQGTKILAVGVSNDGGLNETQFSEVLQRFGLESELTPKEKSNSFKTSRALRSIKQARYFIIQNSRNLCDQLADVEVLLGSAKKNENKISNKLQKAELTLHNLLSSVYTFTETVEQSFKKLGVVRELKYIIQRYEDKVSVAIGLRHCIQHRTTLRLNWLSKYSHKHDIFQHQIGIPLSEVNNDSFYKGKPRDSSGKKYSPVDYYFGDIDSYMIDIYSLSTLINEETDKTYNLIKNELNKKTIEGVEVVEKFYRVAHWVSEEDLY